MTTGNRGAVPFVNGVWRGAPIAVPMKEALTGCQTEIATSVREEGSRPETPRMTGEEDMESGIAETTAKEVKIRSPHMISFVKVSV